MGADQPPDGFADFAVRTRPQLARLAMALIGNASVADDVVTEVLGRAWEKWHSIGELDHPEAYLRRMVTNEYFSLRRRWKRAAPHANLASLLPPTADFADNHADRDELLHRLAALPRKQRAVVTLRFYEGLSDSEIAEAVGCTPSTVRSQLSRALRRLRVELTPSVDVLARPAEVET